MGCQFNLAWIGPCGRDVPDGFTFCADHQDLVCCCCGKQAVKQCPEAGSLVCGYPLCGSCTHAREGDPSVFGHFRREGEDVAGTEVPGS